MKYIIALSLIVACNYQGKKQSIYSPPLEEEPRFQYEKDPQYMDTTPVFYDEDSSMKHYKEYIMDTVIPAKRDSLNLKPSNPYKEYEVYYETK